MCLLILLSNPSVMSDVCADCGDLIAEFWLDATPSCQAPSTPVPAETYLPVLPNATGPVLKGRAVYVSALAGCTVTLDKNNNRKLDHGEPSNSTDPDGVFELDLNGHPKGVLIVRPSTDRSCVDNATSLPPYMELSAPVGCSVISPLSTLAAALTQGARAQCMG